MHLLQYYFTFTCNCLQSVVLNFFSHRIDPDIMCLPFEILPGDQLAIAKETGRRLGMGTNMYPSSSLLGQKKDESIVALPVDELIEKADGFAGVFPGTITNALYASCGFLEPISSPCFRA